MRKPTNIDQYLSRERTQSYLRKVRNDREKKIEKQKSQQKQDEAEGGLGHLLLSHSRLTQLLDEHGVLEKIEPFIPHRRKATIGIPSNFSIISNPVAALKTIYGFISTIKRYHSKLRELNFDHSQMQKVDLAAESIIDLMALDIDHGQRIKRRKIRFSGRYPEDAYLMRYLRAIGIIKNLDIKHEFLPQNEEAKLRIFKMRHNAKPERATAVAAGKKERVVKDFVQHIDKCLHDHGRGLTPDSRKELSEYTGEILGNAEEHSGLGDWTIVGYLDNIHPDHICEIAIFNFGKTIAQSFKELPISSYAYKVVKPYIDAHKKRGFFMPSWTEDDLLTVVALQEHISSKNISESYTRGQGSVEIINFFQKIHKECMKDRQCSAEMALFSGNTHVLFDGTYQMKPDQKGRNVIAFNTDNKLDEPPDNQYVKHLDEFFFPGVIIGIKFPMLPSQTQEVT